MIERSLYIDAPEPGTTALIACTGYTDEELAREEILQTSESSDNYQGWQIRRSLDNGRNWTEPVPIPDVNRQLPNGGIATFPGTPNVDLSTGMAFRTILKRIWPGEELYTFNWATHEHPFHDHVLIQESDGPLRCLRYEPGPEFDPCRPFDPAFAQANRGYRGQSVCFDGEGGAYHPMVCQPENASRGAPHGGLVLMRRLSDGQWLPSNIEFISKTQSSRGLLEPDAVMLKDGRLLIICRGSNTDSTEGRKWMTTSADGGRTIHPVEELRYSDGSRFYSPSSFHRLIRSTQTGTLHWIGNIVADPPEGNLPRDPLIIARFDEDKLGIDRDSVAMIDSRGPADPATIAFSNFRILENRETLELELFMTRSAAFDTPGWKSSVYHYRIQPF